MWGAVLEKGTKYHQDNELAYHVTMAALEPNDKLKGVVSVYVDTEERKNLLICSLRFPDILQVNLDLLFEEGSEVYFHIKGEGKVHLSGYVLPEEGMDPFGGMGDEDLDDEDVSELSDEEEMDNLLGVKRKPGQANAAEPPAKKNKPAEKPATNGDAKKDAKPATNGKQAAKAKPEDSEDDEDFSDEESDGENMNEADLQKLIENIKKQKAAGGGGDDDESDFDDEEDEESEEEEVPKQQAALKAKLNDGKKDFGTPKQAGKGPQQKPQSQQKPQQNQHQKNQQHGGKQGGGFTPGQKKGGFQNKGGFQGQQGKGFTPGGGNRGGFNKSPGSGGKQFNKNNKPHGKWSGNKQRN